jgi:uncharacterized protein (TIGR00375 family)
MAAQHIEIMELYRADLHIHSRFSRATSKTLNLRQLAAWGRVKGLDVVATGDFTHPEWRAEIEEVLVPEGTGLFRLKDSRGLTRELPWLGGYPLSGETRFALCTEISSIYKRGGKVRKVHNLVFMPDMDKARAFSERLAQIGNLESDGRPILGLDSRDLLEIVLETGEGAHLVPAHIWTPWFSLFGSKSGFDAVEECFGDLAGHIFAMETGLSSDPAMNWMWSELDAYQLVSNSDAHSGEKLGREANLFSGDLSYAGMFKALKGESLGDKFLGTIEFFPEEGKYHLDGHRKCGVVLDPHETKTRGGLCPVCGKPLTVGVLNRVMELADREEPKRPSGHPDFQSLIPLKEVLSEITGVGAGSKKVAKRYAALIARFGSEFAVLQDVPIDAVSSVDRVLGEALARMRRGEVLRQAGYDGEYGVIRVFTEQEVREIRGGGTLISMAGTAKPSGQAAEVEQGSAGLEPFSDGRIEFNEAQRRAVAAGPQPVLVVAGPGTGKTQTLLGRIEALLDSGISARRILAATFTRRAAEELGKRLIDMRGEKEALPRADTLHALAFEYWTEAYGEAPVVLDEEAARRAFGRATGLSGHELKSAWTEIQLARERMEQPGEDLAEYFHAYTKLKESWNLADYTDLLVFWLEQIESDIYMNPYTHVLVDEVQDLTPLQLAVARSLVPAGGEGFFAIGDPNQSIYSFRGATGDAADALLAHWPNLETVTLTDNYRSAQLILDAARVLTPDSPAIAAQKKLPGEIKVFSAPGAQAESAWIAERVRELIGSTSHSLADADEGGGLSPGEIAVLVRFKALIDPVRRALDRFGLPVAAPEEEAFWHEPRVAKILDAAGRFLGLTGQEDESGGEGLDLPDSVLSRGPDGMAAYLEDIAPFDRLFWKSPAFRRLANAYREHDGWAGLLNWVNLQTELDQVRAKAEKIQIMTMHAAKGLEFEAVFLPALEDGIVPFAGADFLLGKQGSLNSSNMDEERRLFYVALTRAKSLAFLSHSEKRRLYGKEIRLSPSRFLSSLPDDMLSRSRLVGKKSRREKQLGLL